MTEVAPGSIPAWILAARPATLTAAFAPVAVGTACAWRVGGVSMGCRACGAAGCLSHSDRDELRE